MSHLAKFNRRRRNPFSRDVNRFGSRRALRDTTIMGAAERQGTKQKLLPDLPSTRAPSPLMRSRSERR